MLQDIKVKDWIDLLTQEYKIHEEMFELSVNKTNALVSNNVPEIEHINKKEAELILRLGNYEDKRNILIEKTCLGLGINKDDVTISILLERLEGEGKAGLLELKEKFKELVLELKKVNDLNNSLIKNSLEFIDFSINLIAGADTAADNSYNKTGNIQEPKQKRMFDAKT